MKQQIVKWLVWKKKERTAAKEKRINGKVPGARFPEIGPFKKEKWLLEKKKSRLNKSEEAKRQKGQLASKAPTASRASRCSPWLEHLAKPYLAENDCKKTAQLLAENGHVYARSLATSSALNNWK